MLQDNCFESLVNLIDNLGGISTIPNISIELTDNFLSTSLDPPKGIVKGVEVARYLIDPKCVDCSTSDVTNTEFTPGIWTTAVITSLDKEVEGVIYYWLPISTDIEGNGWFVNTYNVCNVTGNLSLEEERIALAMDGSFQGLKGYKGNKVAILFKVTPNSLIKVATYFKVDDNLPRTNHISNSNQSNLEYNNVDQLCSLEDLSIGMLYLLKQNYVPKEENTIKAYTTLDIDPIYSRTLNKVTERVVNLINTISTNKQFGSIPANLLSFTKAEQLYNDSFYEAEFISFLAESENKIAYTSYDFKWSVPYSIDNVVSSTEGVSNYILVEEGLELIDTLTIAANSLVSRYSSILNNGQQYVIKVSGTISDGTNQIDAAYYSELGDFSDATVIDVSFGTGLFIENAGFFDSAVGYKADHIYEKDWLGTDEALRFSILEDNSYSESKENNTGFFTIEIYRKNYRFIVDDGVDTLLNTVLFSDDLTVEQQVNVKFYRNNCLEDKCYTIIPNNLITDRTVLNSSIAWFLIYLIEYSIKFNLDYSDEINLLSNYLANQIAPNKRMYKGWTGAKVLTESQQIQQYDLYTDVVCMIALAYSYSNTLNTHYLYLAATLNRSILDNHYVDKLLEGQNIVETMVSSLIYSLVMKRVDINETINEYLRARINWDALINTEVNNLLTEGNSTTQTALLFSLNSIAERDLINQVEEVLVKNLNQFSLNAKCLSSSELLDLTYFPFTEINQVITYQNYLTSFIEELPLDFGWFSFEALNNGAIRKVLSSILNVVAPLFGRAYSTQRSKLKSKELTVNLKSLEREYGIKKPVGLSLSEFKEFIFSYFDGGSKAIIENSLNLFKIDTKVINQSDNLIFTNGSLQLGTSYTNKGYISSNPLYTANSFITIVNNHLSTFILDLLKGGVTAGTFNKVKEELFIANQQILIEEDKQICSGIVEGTSFKQMLIDRNYSEAQIELLLDNLVFCLEEMDLTEEEIEIYKYDPRPMISKFANCSIFN